MFIDTQSAWFVSTDIIAKVGVRFGGELTIFREPLTRQSKEEGMKKLIKLFQELKGARLEKNESKDADSLQKNVAELCGIDCCDVVAGDCAN